MANAPIPIKKNLSSIKKLHFEEILKRFVDAKRERQIEGFDGAFVNSAPVGDTFYEPHRVRAWTLNGVTNTILMEVECPMGSKPQYFFDFGVEVPKSVYVS